MGATHVRLDPSHAFAPVLGCPGHVRQGHGLWHEAVRDIRGLSQGGVIRLLFEHQVPWQFIEFAIHYKMGAISYLQDIAFGDQVIAQDIKGIRAAVDRDKFTTGEPNLVEAHG